MTSDSAAINRQIEHEYVLERLGEIRDLIADLLEGGPVGEIRFHYTPNGGESALEAVAAAVYAAERLWTR